MPGEKMPEKQDAIDVPMLSRVYCTDGLFGQAMNIILLPDTKRITHLVVVQKANPKIGYLVSLDRIIKSTEKTIHLDCTKEMLTRISIYDQVESLPPKLVQAVRQNFGGFIARNSGKKQLEREIEPGSNLELLLCNGVAVRATDGLAGIVDEFLVNPKDDQIMELVLREGRYQRRRRVSIPALFIDRYAKNIFYLKLDLRSIERFPTISSGGMLI